MTQGRRLIAGLAVTFLTLLVFIPGCNRRFATNAGQQGETTGGEKSDLTGSLESGGVRRTYLIHLPSSYDGRTALPLVLAFHGGGGDGQGMERMTHFDSIADEHDFIVAFPDGLNKQWNDGRPEVNSKIDDVGFISKLIDRLEQDYRIDPRRVYATGMSNGALFTYRLAFQLSDKIAAYAPVAGLLGVSLSQTSPPPRDVPIMITLGSDDPIMPWSGGEVTVLNSGRGLVLSEPATLSFWVTLDKCSPTPASDYYPDKDPNDGTRIRREIYSGGNGIQVILLAVEGGGHAWPGGLPYLSERIIGKTSKDIDDGEVIWEFFQKYEK